MPIKIRAIILILWWMIFLSCHNIISKFKSVFAPDDLFLDGSWKVRAQALLCINYGGYKLHPYPLSHLSHILIMKVLSKGFYNVKFTIIFSEKNYWGLSLFPFRRKTWSPCVMIVASKPAKMKRVTCSSQPGRKSLTCPKHCRILAFWLQMIRGNLSVILTIGYLSSMIKFCLSLDNTTIQSFCTSYLLIHVKKKSFSACWKYWRSKTEYLGKTDDWSSG